MTAPLPPTTASDAEPIDDVGLAEVRERFDAITNAEPNSLTGHVKGLLALIDQLSAEVAAKDAEIEKLNSRLAFALDEGTSWACKAGRYARSATDAEAEAAGLRADLGRVLTWAESRCPCRHEEPNPCSLCGASVENLEACKSAENTLPRDILVALRSAKARASLSPRMEASDDA